MNMYGEKVAVLNAVWLSPVIPVLHIILLRILKNDKILIPTLIGSICYFGLWLWLTFSSFTFEFLSMPEVVRLLIAGGSTIGFMSMAYLTVIGHPFRGFTMNILINTELNQPVTSQEMILKMRKGERTNWFVRDRIQIMVKENLLKFESNSLKLLPKGVFIGRMGLIVKNFLNMGPGG